VWLAATLVAGGVALLLWAVWRRSAQATRDRINVETQQEVAEIMNRVDRVDTEVSGMDEDELDALVFGPRAPGVPGAAGGDGGPERR
jgi:hypothetical protein